MSKLEADRNFSVYLKATGKLFGMQYVCQLGLAISPFVRISVAETKAQTPLKAWFI
jgi:hypothetical protein